MHIPEIPPNYVLDIDEPDGTAIVELDDPTFQARWWGDIFPGGPHGIFPNVVLAATFSSDVVAWWAHLSPPCQAVLQLDAGGAIPPEFRGEVTSAGSQWVPASWPAAPDEATRLPVACRYMVREVALRHRYTAAQDTLDTTIGPYKWKAPYRIDGRPLVGERAEVQTLTRLRNEAKIAYDLHRATVHGA